MAIKKRFRHATSESHTEKGTKISFTPSQILYRMAPIFKHKSMAASIQRSSHLGAPIDTSCFERLMQEAAEERPFVRKFTTWLPQEHDTLLEQIEQLSQTIPRDYWSRIGKPLYDRVNDAKTRHIPINALDQSLTDLIGSLFLHRQGIGLPKPEIPLADQTHALQELSSAIFAEASQAPFLVWNTDFQPSQIWTLEENTLHLSAHLANRGLFAWTIFARTLVKHHLLTPTLIEEVRDVMQTLFSHNFTISQDAVENKFYSQVFGNQCLSKIEPLLSDILPILRLGPTAAFTLFQEENVLHALIAKETVARLPIETNLAWTNAIDTEIKKRHSYTIILDNAPVPFTIVEKAMEHLSEKLLTTKFSSLQDRTLMEVSSWNQIEEQNTKIITLLLQSAPSTHLPGSSPFTAHQILAAAFTESMKQDASLPEIFEHMTSLLKELHWMNMYRETN